MYPGRKTMAKRKQRKGGGKSEKSPTKSKAKPRIKAQDHPPAPQPAGSAVNASMLLDELQQRCDSLRQWQRQTSEDLRARQAKAEEREQDLAQTQDRLERESTHLELDQDAIKRARLMLEKEKAQIEQTQQALETERGFLERSGVELEDQKQQVTQMRQELEEEWASLGRTRQAQEASATALDEERLRIQGLRLNNGLGGIEKPTGLSGQDSGPGLSLTQAA